MTEQQKIRALCRAAQQTLDWLADGTPDSERSAQEWRVIDSLRCGMIMAEHMPTPDVFGGLEHAP